jgi:phenylacetate-coenzyme A ligase PaaK-like adenylate-forming protein
LRTAGASEARIAAAYAPPESHVLWGECAVPAGRSETFGFHTFPDLGLVEVLSPETTEPLPPESPGELVITPLVFRGSGLPRWRTGDLALGGITNEPCPNCARTIPRVGPTVLGQAWRREVSLNGRRTLVDLRDAGAAAAERAREWQVELERSRLGDRLFIHLAAGPEPGPMIDLYEDLRRLQEAPTQIVLADTAELAARVERAPRPWPRYLERGDAS